MSGDDLIPFLQAAAPNAYCLRCLREAFRDVWRRIEDAMTRREPVEVVPGRCIICGDKGNVVRYQSIT
jgi:hypothetical protein